MISRIHSINTKKQGKAQICSSLMFVLLLTLVFTYCTAQTANELTKEGNTLYKDRKYNEAEVKYRKSIAAEKENKAAQYNLGNAFYQQSNFEGATKQYEQVIQRKDLSKEQKAQALHNLGNSLIQEKKYEESINAFKESLKLNPKDNDTRYNLAYAQSMLQKQQQQNQQKNNQQNQKEDKKKQQDQQQGKDQQKKDQQQQQDKSASADKNKESKEQGKSGKQGISKEDAEKMLQSLNNDEKNLQKKLNKKESSRIAIEKNW